MRIESKIDTESTSFEEYSEFHKKLGEKLIHKLTEAAEGGGAKARSGKRQRQTQCS